MPEKKSRDRKRSQRRVKRARKEEQGPETVTKKGETFPKRRTGTGNGHEEEENRARKEEQSSKTITIKG